MASSKRVRRNDGSVSLRKDGRWQGRYMITLLDGTRKRQSVYGATAEEARSLMRKEMYAAASGTPVLHNGLKVEDYLLSWIKIAPTVNEGTRYKYLGTIRKHIVPYLGKKNLSSLTSTDVQCMLDSQLSKGITPRVAQIIRNTLSAALKYALGKDLVSKNVARNVYLPKYEMPEKKVWNKEQALVFKDAIRESKYRFIFEMLLTYGVRRGEALALGWDDVDCANDKIRIRKQYTYVGNALEVCEPKTKNSKRDLPILPHIEKLLNELRPINQTGAISVVNGELVKPNSLQWEFEQIIKKTGLPTVTLHSLRHFAATSLKEAGVSIKDAQMILGHASPYTTMNNYQHSTIESKKEALEKYAESMAF
ncbi:MAG: site-specific integrase [Candidatus Nomurabacteria bacterium]|jgi:integrase|nr:site-specific integrase [Candidatus Nomurabacteria bacterium]